MFEVIHNDQVYGSSVKIKYTRETLKKYWIGLTGFIFDVNKKRIFHKKK